MEQKHQESDKLADSEGIYLEALQVRIDQLTNELNFIKGSRGYRLLERTRTLPFIQLIVRLAKFLMPGDVPPPPTTQPPDRNITEGEAPNSNIEAKSAETKDVISTPAVNIRGNSQRSTRDQNWVIEQQELRRPISINHPEWRGILSASSELFKNIFTIPDDLNQDRALYYAELVKDAAPPSITIQGFPLSYYHLIKSLKEIAPEIPVYVIYHGNFLHVREDYDWESLKLIVALSQEGAIKKVGFVKQGMAEIFIKAGIQAYFLTNIIRAIPERPSQPIDDRYTHIGIWAYPDWSWKKLPYAMLASLNLIDKCKGHIHNVSSRAQEFGDLLQIDASYQIDPISRHSVLKKMTKMHLNLNVSLTECSPMLPLESLSVGTPCLLGPTSHYFLDHEYLHRCLVVPYPDNSERIAQFANRALEERNQIVQAYIEYAPAYNRQALDMLAEFLEYPVE